MGKLKDNSDSYVLLDSDPRHKPTKTSVRRVYNNPFWNTKHRSKHIKPLTNKRKFDKMELVNKLNVRKDDKMANDKKQKTSNRNNTIKSVAWLAEATFRVFVGWVLLSHFDNLVTTSAAFYALGTAGIIVVTHFVRAHK